MEQQRQQLAGLQQQHKQQHWSQKAATAKVPTSAPALSLLDIQLEQALQLKENPLPAQPSYASRVR